MSIFPTKILLATDGSKEAEMAATTAIYLANNTNSELHILTVAPGYPSYNVRVPEVAEELQRQAQKILDEQAKKIEQAGGKIAQRHLRLAEHHPGIEHHPSDDVVGVAEEIGADLIVLGSRGLGSVRRALMGSVSDAVVRHAHCPVMVVRGEPVSFPIKILLATDGSEEAALAAKAATNIANLCGSQLHVVHVEEYPPYLIADYGSFAYLDAHSFQTILEEADRQARNILDERVSHIEGAGGTVTRSYLRQGRPNKELVDLAEEIGAGLIVMGGRGLSGMRRALIGSVSDSVVRHAHCPVMVVRYFSHRERVEEAAKTLLQAMRDVHNERHPDQRFQEGTPLHPYLAAERLELSLEHSDYVDAMRWLQYSGALVPHDPATTLSAMDTLEITRRGLEILEEDS